METTSSSTGRQWRMQRRAGRASLCSAALIAAICLGGASGVSAATQQEPPAVAANPSDSSRVPGFIPLDPSTQPQAGSTGVQVPDAASNREVRGQYGVGLVLLTLGVVITAALVVGLFMVVVRRTWDSRHTSR